MQIEESETKEKKLQNLKMCTIMETPHKTKQATDTRMVITSVKTQSLFCRSRMSCRWFCVVANRSYAFFGAQFRLCTLAASFGMDRGMNFLWLVVMYIFGAWVKKCGIADLVNSKTACLVFILSCAFSWLFKILSPVRGDLLICYTSPTVVLAALMLLLLFSKWEMGDKAWSVVRYISPATFGVYILHMQPFIKENVLKDAFSAFASLPWFLLLFAVLSVAAGIFILCVLIEKIREFLFEYLKINAFTEKYAQKAEIFLRKHLAGILNHIP